MGVMFDIKILDYTQVLNSRTDLSITKDKDKEQRKRRQKKVKYRLQSNKQKRQKIPFQKIKFIRSHRLINSCSDA